MNKAIIIGNCGRDPEVRSFPSGDRVVSFSVATKESWRDKNTGERKDRTEWHNISIFNEHIGKIAEQYVRKGSLVYIEGQIQTRAWTDKDGNERKSTEIVLPRFGGTIELLGDKRKADDEQERTASAAKERTRPGSMKDELDDYIPF